MPTEPLRVLSVIPPMTQLNTPYPSTAYLTGFLRSRGIGAVQEDLALALVLRLFTPAGLDAVCERAQALPEAERSASVHAFLDQFALYRSTIATVIGFLICLLLLMSVSLLSLGVFSQPTLAGLKNPSMAGVLENAVGTWGAVLIYVGLIVSVGGGFLAWITRPKYFLD